MGNLEARSEKREARLMATLAAFGFGCGAVKAWGMLAHRSFSGDERYWAWGMLAHHSFSEGEGYWARGAGHGK